NVEEAWAVVKELLKKQDAVLLDDVYTMEQTQVSDVKSLLASGREDVNQVFGEGWIGLAEQRVKELEDRSQMVYVGNFEKPETGIQVHIYSPYLSPKSLEVYDGTYIIFTMIKKDGEQDGEEGDDNLGKKISLDSELPVDYLEGVWTIHKRELDSKYDDQVPEVTISIEEYIGSISETEIEAERFLFSGEIQIGDVVYQAYSELDAVNIFKYPIAYISIFKEEGMEPVFDIMVSDIDRDYELFIASDFNYTFDNGFYINIDSSIDGEYYESDDDEIDYLIRK
ncbi:MAG: hypothetical protein ACLFUI_05695, partial [Halanaerobiales bacterium]